VVVALGLWITRSKLPDALRRRKIAVKPATISGI
jgi:hypothetical protein